MKYALSIMLLGSMFVSIYAADNTQPVCCKLPLSAADAAMVGLSARRINSLIEAYMEGEFAASNKKGCLTYDDYETRAIRKEGWAFEDTVEKINEDIEAVYGSISSAINGLKPLDFHVILGRCKGKEEKITYLKELQEADKKHIQSIRLYDFLQGINIDLPGAVLQEWQKIVDDKQLSEQDKAHAIKSLMGPQDEAAREVKANRSVLEKAVKSGDPAQVLEACKKPLHIAGFVPLHVVITKMIADIEADKDNSLLSNQSRDLQECIIS